MAVTIKKIAELAGVSTGTVDRALHDRGRVDPKVAQRIKQIAIELDYRPNSVAKSLSTRNKNIKIAVILHVQSRNLYFDDVIHGIEKCRDEIKDFGIAVEIRTCPDFNAAAQLELINRSIAEGANAIAIVPINNPLIKDRLNELHRENYPVVFLTNIIEDTDYLSYVGCNYELAGQVTAGLLHMLKPENGKLLLFSPSFQMYGHTLRANGLKQHLMEEYPQIQLQDIYEMTGDDIRDYQITKDALMIHPDTNLFVCPGAYSRGNLQAIQECGYFQKSRIICYDYSDEIGSEIQKGNIVATITQCPQEQGYNAVKILFEYLTANKPPRFKNHYIRTRIILKENISEITQIRAEYN
ncbi:MAG: LacI family DNA-binding transcriptional regulator [Eubacteriales bacterium]|nr:LacI family DNA-binding transcriptional regulator [Eubacteriales bacterium]